MSLVVFSVIGIFEYILIVVSRVTKFSMDKSPVDTWVSNISLWLFSTGFLGLSLLSGVLLLGENAEIWSLVTVSISFRSMGKKNINSCK
ncbi:hypothetical protein GDO81_029143 [Engystomops pustulosus]|uniref:NADH dehydrogenase subunit 6 n=1 Tax=Engystomops pustulosus TaxID=76066 RepID=A0AAV6YGH3_ENGPU|nr:hypothetical protein GDO81_029143 [Engystomops pustulosus]